MTVLAAWCGMAVMGWTQLGRDRRAGQPGPKRNTLVMDAVGYNRATIGAAKRLSRKREFVCR